MILNHSNIFLKEESNNEFIVCIELPDKSRNYLHSQKMSLQDCLFAKQDLVSCIIENDAESPYLERDDTYFRIKMTIPSKNLSLCHPLYFHSRKLNLNDAVAELTMLITNQDE